MNDELIFFNKEILDPSHRSIYFTSKNLNSIIKKSISKDNVKFAHEIFEKMIEHDVIPDDVTYSYLIEELLAANYQDYAFSLYIHVKYFWQIILSKTFLRLI